jgi:hypothetical protein
MKVFLGEWDTSHDERQWGADILQAVVKEKLNMKKVLVSVFRDDAEKDRLLTYVRLFFFTYHSFSNHVLRFCTAREGCSIP